MSFISFAQNLEDLMLWRALEKFGPGFYIDVGACDPIVDSVTKVFYDAGWRGINIEPMQSAFEKIKGMRPRDINLNIGLDAQSGIKTFYSVDEGNGLSTSVQEYAEHYINEGRIVKEQKIAVSTLDEIFETYVNQDIHFLKIDVEGSEKQVLEGSKFKKFRPWIILTESTIPNTEIPSNEEWEHILINANYKFVYFDGLNRYYVANEKKAELEKYFSSPPNLFDKFQKSSDFFNSQELKKYQETTFEIKSILLSLANELSIEEIRVDGDLAITPEELINQYKIITNAINNFKTKNHDEIIQIKADHENSINQLDLQHNDKINQLNLEHDHEINQLKCEIENKIAHLESINSDEKSRVSKLNIELDICAQELYESSRHIGALCKDRHNANIHKNDANIKLSNLNVELNDLNVKFDDAELRLEKIQKESELNLYIYKERITQLEQIETVLSHEISAIRKSRSWKITQPLRSGLIMMRKFGAKK